MNLEGQDAPGVESPEDVGSNCPWPSRVIFDGDDTLWMTEPLYDDARDAARALVEAAGFDGSRWEEIQRVLDVDNVARFGHSPDRFPTSCVEALEAVSTLEAVMLDAGLREAVRTAAASVFVAVAPLRDSVAQMLHAFRRHGSKLALLTKGDFSVQRKRIADSGLGDLFEVIEIVESKSASDFIAVASRLGREEGVGDVVAIGNSVRSDVIPAAEAGMRVIWLPAYVWEYEAALDHRLPDGVQEIRGFDELASLVGIQLSPERA